MEQNGFGRRSVLAGAVGIAGMMASGTQAAKHSGRTDAVPSTSQIGHMELVVAARCPTSPTGMTVSAKGRIFVFMPRFDDKTLYSVGEVAADGGVTPYPDAAINRPDPTRPQDTLFNIPNGVIDGQDRLWMLDAGLMAASGVPVPGAAKLLCIDLTTNTVIRTIPLGAAVEPTSSLNDLRVDAGNGRREAAYITDQGQDGKGAIIAVDLATGRAVRRLARHSSTASNKGVVKIVEGRQLLKRGADGSTSEVQGGANGIALGPDGKLLYYAPLMGRHLHSVETAALLDLQAEDAAIAATVKDLGEKGLTGGLLADTGPDGRDRVYLAMQEFNAIGRRNADGGIEILATDPRLIWADTLWIHDNWVYISSSQVNRRAEYNRGLDQQKPPYAILRTRVDAV